jgi:hypothetical protein
MTIQDSFTTYGFLLLMMTWFGCIVVALIFRASAIAVASAKTVAFVLLFLYLVGLFVVPLIVQG